MDRLDAMRAFVAVATRGSFAEAARHLHLSPTAVTRAVAGLEDRLGLMLLVRTTRSVPAYRLRARSIWRRASASSPTSMPPTGGCAARRPHRGDC